MNEQDNPPRVAIKTLGCRLNQYESQAIREQFMRAGYQVTEKSNEADVYVVNTCTVTSESDRESRYLIRKFHRANPNAKIVVTGCYVERNQKEVESLAGVTLTVLNREKSELLDLLESCVSGTLNREIPSRRRFAPLSISEFEGRTRAYVKIQDGCNHACSFCKVVLARGPSRSREIQEIDAEVRRLVQSGYQEIVLTGIQLGAFGYDRSRRQILAELLRLLSEIEGLAGIRLSSIEPTDVTDELIDAMAGLEKVCPHLHIPLQSGADEILRKMNRRYGRKFFIGLIRKLRRSIPDFVLTTDVMVGFPGETDVCFGETLETIVETMPYKLHVFPYSPREGTKASRMTDVPAREVCNLRKESLFELEGKLRQSVSESFIGRVLDLLVEKAEESAGTIRGRLRNFIRVKVQSIGAKRGEIVPVEIRGMDGDCLIGRQI